MQKVRELHRIGGGKTVYLECEDKLVLTEFYKKHGFVEFDRRKLDHEEINDFQGTELIQMIAYLG